MDKERVFFRALKGLSWLTQLGFSLVCPPLLCVYVAMKLQQNFKIGNWIIIVAVVVGILSAACTFISFARQMLSDAMSGDKSKEGDNNEA